TGATGAAATGAARSGASRWLGPIAGIAAGLGLAALLSSMGLGAAAAEFIGSLLLIALVVFAIMFIVRRLRGAGSQSRPAFQSVGQTGGAAPMQRQAHVPPAQPASLSRHNPTSHTAVANTAAPAVDESWHIPEGF